MNCVIERDRYNIQTRHLVKYPYFKYFYRVIQNRSDQNKYTRRSAQPLSIIYSKYNGNNEYYAHKSKDPIWLSMVSIHLYDRYIIELPLST